MRLLQAAATVFHGLSTTDANNRLISDVKRHLDEESKRMLQASPAWLIARSLLLRHFPCKRSFHPASPLSAFAVVASNRLSSPAECSLLVAAALLLAAFCTATHRVELIVGSCLCVFLFLLNAALLTRRMLLLRWEKMDRIRVALAGFEMCVAPPKQSPHTNDARRAHIRRTYRQAAKCLEFHTSAKIATGVLVYRDSEWIRLPSCLLVEGDIIALLQGELKLHTHLEFVDPEQKIKELTSVDPPRSIPHPLFSVRSIARGMSERVVQKTAPLRDSGMDVRRTESNPLLEVSGEHTHAPIDTPVDATADPVVSGGLEDTVAFTESAVVNTPGTSQSNEVLVSIPSAIPIANRLTSPAPGLPAQAVPSVIPSVKEAPVTEQRHAGGRKHSSKPVSPSKPYIPPAEEDMIRDIDTLKLCGGLRRYYVTRTLMVGILTGALREDGDDHANRRMEDQAQGQPRNRQVIGGLQHLNLPRPPFLVQFRAGMHLLGSLQALIALLLIAGLCVRSSFSTTFSAYTPGVLEGLSVGLILLAPSAIPALASLTEALCTAHVLSYLEAAVVRAKWKLKLVAHKISIASEGAVFAPILHKKSSSKTKTKPTAPPTEETPLAADEDSDASGESMSESDSDAEYEEPADYKGIGYVPGSQWAGPDFTSISGKGWRDLQWKRKWHYLKRIWFPWNVSSKALISSAVPPQDSRVYTPETNVGFGVSEFPPPLVANLFLQRMAALTVFVCGDRGTVCEDEPVVDTILLLRGAKQLVILDLHADPASRFGVEFNDIYWKRHLQSLKPIALASLLGTRMPNPLSAAGALEELEKLQSRRLRRRKHHNRRRDKRKQAKKALEDQKEAAAVANSPPVDAVVVQVAPSKTSPALQPSASVSSARTRISQLFKAKLAPLGPVADGTSLAPVSSKPPLPDTSKPSIFPRMRLLRNAGDGTTFHRSETSPTPSPSAGTASPWYKKPFNLKKKVGTPGDTSRSPPLSSPSPPSPTTPMLHVSSSLPVMSAAPVVPSPIPRSQTVDLTFDSHAAVPHLDLAGDAVAVEDDAGSVVSDPGATAVRRSSDSKRVTTSEDIVSPLQRRGSDSDLAVTTRGLLRSSSSRGSTSSHSVRTQLTPDAVGIPSSLSAVLRSQPVTPANITKSLSTIPNVPAANVLPDPPAIPPVTTAVDSTSSDSSESDSSSTTSGYSVISDTDSSDSKASGDSGDTVPFSAAGGDAVPARKRPSKGAKRSRRRVDEFDWLKMTESDYGSEFDTDQSSSSSSSSSTSSPVVNGGEEKEAEVLVASDGGDDVAMQSGDSVGMVDRIGTSGRLPSRRNRVGSDASDQRSIEERLEEGMMMHAVDANEMGQEAVVEEQHFPVRAADSHSEHTTVCCDAEDCDAEHHEVVNCPAPALTRNFSTMPPTPDGIHRSVSDSEYMREALRARVDDDLGQNIPGEQGPSPSPHHKHHHHHHRRLGRARSTIIYRVPFDDAVKRSELLDTESRSHASGSTTNNPRHFDDLPSDALLESTVYAPFTEDAMAVADTVLPSPNKESSQDGFPALTSAPTTDTSPVHSSPSKTMSSFELLRPSRTTSLAVRAVGFAEEHVDIMKKSSSAVEMRELLDHAAPQPATQSAPTHSHNRSSTRRSDQMKHVKRSLEDIRSHQRLAACVRKVKPCHWLTQMAHQVGFTREDIDKYRHRKHSFTVACRGGSALKPIDFSSPSLVDASSDGTLTRGGTEVSRSRSVPRSQQRVVGRKHTQPWLLPVVSCTVVEEPKEKSKSHPRLQMFTNGLPQFVLPECTDYWDGTQIWSMDPSRRDSVMEVSRQWQQEGMIVHAFSYNPISVKETEIFDMIDVLLGSYEADLLAKAKYGTREGLTSSTSTGPNTSPCKPLIGLSVDQSSIFLLAQLANRSNSVAPVMPHATLAPVSLDLSSGASSGIASLPPSVDPRIVETEKRLHQMQSSQILLGLVGARAAPKADSRRLVSHLDKAGVRFVYASPQSFKRTKNIAGKLGLETDWNCGISLAETRQPHKDKRYPMEEKQDPESMFHNENMDEDEHFGEGVLTVTAMKKKILNKTSDVWDERAKLPHGIKEIREHLVNEDDVPLQVKLFTDSTTHAVQDMIRIFQERGDIVCLVGTALVGSTPELCRYADVALCIGPAEPSGPSVAAAATPTLPTTRSRKKREGNQTVPPAAEATNPASPPQHPEPAAGKPAGPNPYLRFAAAVSALPCSVTLPHDVPLKVFVKILTDARRSLGGMGQCLALAGLAQATLACIHLLCVWIGLPDLFPIHHALWLTLVIIPLISLSMLFAYVDPEDMTPMRTPPKRVVYPDTFIAPDRAQCPWKETVKTPPLTSNSTSTTDPDDLLYAPVVRCLGYNDASSHLSGHPDELLIGWPSNDVRVEKSLPPFIPPETKRRLYLAGVGVFPAICMVIVTFSLALADSSTLTYFRWAHEPPIQRNNLVPQEVSNRAVVRAQGIAMLSLVLWLIGLSAHMLQRSQNVWKMNPLRNTGWVIFCCLALAAQIVYSLIHTAIVSSSTIFSSGSASFSWYTWVVALLWPVGGTVVCGALKALDVKEFERHMRWTRHHFGTRLGRYSPR